MSTYTTRFTVCFLVWSFKYFVVFDIINFYISSKRFKGLILNSSSHYKQLFESMNYVCDKKNWNFLYWRFRFYSFVFSSLSLCSVFSHFCFCKRTCDQRTPESAIVNSVLEFIYKPLIIIILFKTLVLINEILLASLINFFGQVHFFLSTFTMIMPFL